MMILLAKYLYLVIIFVAIAFLLFQPRKIQKKLIIFALICLPLAYLVAKIAGHFYFDPRPFVAHHFKPLIPHAPSNGFPSDHALISFAIAGIIFAFNRKLGVTLGVLGLLVGVSRLYVGVHSPIDILGSLVIAAIATVFVEYILKRYFRFGL